MTALLTLFLPEAVYAASSVADLTAKLTTNVINPLIAILFALGFVLFMWGAAMYVWGWGAPGEKEKGLGAGKSHMVWGLVGMLIMVSAYGIINLAGSIIGVPSR